MRLPGDREPGANTVVDEFADCADRESPRRPPIRVVDVDNPLLRRPSPNRVNPEPLVLRPLPAKLLELVPEALPREVKRLPALVDVSPRVVGLIVDDRPRPEATPERPNEVGDDGPLIRRRPVDPRVERAIDLPDDRDDPRPIFLEEREPRLREALRLDRDADRRPNEDDRRPDDRPLEPRRDTDRDLLALDRPPRELRDAEDLDRREEERPADRDPPLLDDRDAEREDPRPLGGPPCTSTVAAAAKKTARAIENFRPIVRLGTITLPSFQIVQFLIAAKARTRK